MMTFTAVEAMTVSRLFVRLEQQMDVARKEGREADELALARLAGSLSWKIFQCTREDFDCPFSPPPRTEFQIHTEVSQCR